MKGRRNLEKRNVKKDNQKDGEGRNRKQDEGKQQRINQPVYLFFLVLFFDQLQREGLSKTKRTQVKKIGDPEKQQPDAVTFVSQMANQAGCKDKHGNHI